MRLNPHRLADAAARTRSACPAMAWLVAVGASALVGFAAPARADNDNVGHGGPPIGVWKKIDNLKPVIGVDHKPHTAACSGYPNTDARFSFWSKRGRSKNLVLYFEGGGACWDNLTCTFPITAGLPATVPQFFVPAVPAATDPAAYDGIFNATNAANPVKDWSFVYVPYCSGDVHTGSATRTYFNAGHPVFAFLPGQFDIQHRGFDNFMVVLDWVKKNVDDPERVLVAGSSAGGYGASANFPWVHKLFPRADMAVLADASQGVTTTAWDKNLPGRGSWNQQLAPAVFGNDPSALASRELLRKAAASFPRARVGQFTTNLDTVQIGFYGLMKQYYGPGGSCSNLAVDWNQQAVGTLKSYVSTTPNYRHYLAQGQYHTILRSPLFFTEASAGVSFKDWFAAMVGRRGHGHDDDDDDAPSSPWRNVACPGCLNAAVCP